MILSRNTVVPLIRKIVCLVIALKVQTENCLSLLPITTLIRIRIRMLTKWCLSTDGKHQISMSDKHVTKVCISVPVEEAVDKFKEPAIALKKDKAEHKIKLKNA